MQMKWIAAVSNQVHKILNKFCHVDVIWSKHMIRNINFRKPSSQIIVVNASWPWPSKLTVCSPTSKYAGIKKTQPNKSRCIKPAQACKKQKKSQHPCQIEPRPIDCFQQIIQPSSHQCRLVTESNPRHSHDLHECRPQLSSASSRCSRSGLPKWFNVLCFDGGWQVPQMTENLHPVDKIIDLVFGASNLPIAPTGKIRTEVILTKIPSPPNFNFILDISRAV